MESKQEIFESDDSWTIDYQDMKHTVFNVKSGIDREDRGASLNGELVKINDKDYLVLGVETFADGRTLKPESVLGLMVTDEFYSCVSEEWGCN